MGNLFQELKRRKVYNVITAYVVTSWLLLQVADTLFPAFDLPDNAIRIPALLLLVGFPIVLVLAWVFEITPEGIKKTVSVTPENAVELRRLDYLVVCVVLVLIGVVSAQQYVILSRTSESQSIEKSIAVLPFVALSSGEEDGYFADGLTEELLNSLAQLSDLKVAARTSSFYFKGKEEDIRGIGATLDVAHVLEGSVRRADNRIRVTAQLIDVNTGFNLWSANYDAQLDDIFAIQDEIASEVSSALQIQILGEEFLSLNSHGTTNAEAEALYMIASARLRELSRSSGYFSSNTILQNPTAAGRARALFEEITRLDPNYAEAWAGLTEILVLLSEIGTTESTGTTLSRREGIRLAQQSLQRALDLAPNATSTRLASASLKLLEVLSSGADFQFLAEEYENILEADPTNVFVLEQAARFHARFLNIDRGIALLDRVLELDPLSTAMLDRANLLLNWKPEEARQQFLRVGELYPETDWKWGIAQIEYQLGHLHHAILWTEGAYLRNPRYEALFFALGDEQRGFELKENRTAQSGGTQSTYLNLDLDFWRRDYEKILATLSDSGQTIGGRTMWMRYGVLLRLGRYEEVIEFFDEEYGLTDFELLQFDGRIQAAIEVSHAMQQVGDVERAELVRAGLREAIEDEPMVEYIDERIFKKYQSEILFFILASEGRVEEAIDQFEIMIESGWRWLAGFSPRTARTKWISNLWFRFEEHPILDSMRDNPRFIELLNFVKEDNARMLAELQNGLSLEDIVDEL